MRVPSRLARVRRSRLALLWRPVAGGRGRALALGALAFLAGYAAVYGLTAEWVVAAVRDGDRFAPGSLPATVPPELASVGAATGTAPTVWQRVTWAYLGAHGVDLTLTVSAGTLRGGGTTAVAGVAPGSLAAAVPPVATLLAGTVAARGSPVDDRRGAARAGARVAAGYAALGVAAAVAGTWSTGLDLVGSGSLSYGPSAFEAAVATGAYAVAFGALGGLLAHVAGQTGSRPSGRGDGPPEDAATAEVQSVGTRTRDAATDDPAADGLAAPGASDADAAAPDSTDDDRPGDGDKAFGRSRGTNDR